MKFLRTIRFDKSDDNIFEAAAQAGEWAVSGAFAFADLEPDDIAGKTRQAFANGFLSVHSWGRSTFASVTEIGQSDFNHLEQTLAAHFVEIYGAPAIEAALPAAHQEMDFIIELCQGHPVNTVFMLRRNHDEQGQIREEYRTVRAQNDDTTHARIWSISEDDE